MTNLSEIIISSTPLDNDKLHAVDGALLGATYTYNYDTIGTVNNSGGVVSGFTSTDFIKLPNLFNPANSNWEYVIRFTTGSSTTTFQIISAIINENFQTQFEYWIGTNGNLYAELYGSIGESRAIVNNIAPNTTYKVKTSYDGTSYKIYRDTNLNDNWTLIDTISKADTITGSSTIRLGVQKKGTSEVEGQNPLLGSIDLNETSISINNQTWWQYEATSSSPYSEFISYIADLYNDDPNAEYFAPVGINSYTKVGTLTDNDGVISGFDNDSYIQLSAFNPGSYTWEYVLKFTTGSNTSGEQALTSCLGNGDYCTPFYIQDNQVKAYMSTDGTSWNSTFSGEYLTLATNTTYKLKAEFTGTHYNWYRYDNGNWIQLKSVSYPTPVASGGTIIFGNNRGTGNPFGGSIDLNESYIKINGSLWWGMADEKFIYDSVNQTVKLPKYGNKLYTTDNTASNVYYYIQVKE